MDRLGSALFGLFLVSFTVSKPISQYEHLISSSESSESNESSSSEEVTGPRATIHPVTLNSARPDDLQQSSDPSFTSAHAAPAQTTPRAADIEQRVVELELNASLGPPQPPAPSTAAPHVTSPELRCFTVDLTSPEPKPARGDSI